MNNQAHQQRQTTTTTTGVETRLARHGGISSLHIPAIDVRRSAAFYEQVFGWKIHGRETDHLGFDDGTGHFSRGRTFGTLLVDLSAHQVIDLPGFALLRQWVIHAL